MGLGKTLSMISLIHTVSNYTQLGIKRVLIICPKTTIMNWADEIFKWCGPLTSAIDLKVFQFSDATKIDGKMDILKAWHNVKHRQVNVMLIGYESFRYYALLEEQKKQEAAVELHLGAIQRCLLEPGPDMVNFQL